MCISHVIVNTHRIYSKWIGSIENPRDIWIESEQSICFQSFIPDDKREKVYLTVCNDHQCSDSLKMLHANNHTNE